MVACSSDDMESSLKKRQLEEAGFDGATNSPLTVNYVKEQLIQMIDKNIQNLEGLFNIHKYQQQSSNHSQISGRIQLPQNNFSGLLLSIKNLS